MLINIQMKRFKLHLSLSLPTILLLTSLSINGVVCGRRVTSGTSGDSYNMYNGPLIGTLAKYTNSSLLVKSSHGYYTMYSKLRVGKYQLDMIECCKDKENKEFVTNLLTVWNDKLLYQYKIKRALSNSNHVNPVVTLGVDAWATYPGTEYCLVGEKANSPILDMAYRKPPMPLNDLDQCCMQRYTCPTQITESGNYLSDLPLEAGDNLKRVTCKCDEEFRSCLHSLNSQDADYVGILFFNIFQIKCIDKKELCLDSAGHIKYSCGPMDQKLFTYNWKSATKSFN